MQELMGLVQQLMNYIDQSGSSLNEATQKELAVFLQEVWTFIEQHVQRNPTESLSPTSQIPQLEPGPYPSSNVNSFRYDPKSQQLLVKFHGKDTAESGPVYSYGGVPKFIYDVFSRGAVAPKTSGQNKYHRWIKGVTPSLGASMYALIRNGGFSYSKVA